MKSSFKNRKGKVKYQKLRDFTDEIIEIFEEKLEELGITLPDSQREESSDEARIYGSNYYELESSITEFISANKKQLSKII